ncbi:MAG: M20/M25/M40 family metallo-hydrolase [Pseudomonadota bacterium]
MGAKWITGFCALCAAAMLPATVQAELTAAEQAIDTTVEAQYGYHVALLEKLTNQNSGTRNIEGNRAVMAMLRPEFERLGFRVEIVDQSEVGRAGHFFAIREGNGQGRKMLLIAHTDTVFEADSNFQTFVRNGDTATGPGIGDDKGGIIIILAALRAMQVAGTLEGADIVVAITGDEEDAGDPISISRADLVRWGQWADVALDFEGLSVQDGRDMGVVARRSSNSWELRTTGRSGHSSGIFSENAGDGAIFELARIIARFREELPEPNLTFNVGLISGGARVELHETGLHTAASGKTNIIPAMALARGDFRTLSEEQSERVRNRMRAIVADHLPRTEASITFDEGSYPPMAPTEGNRALLAELNAINRDLGLAEQPELDPLKRGAGDVSFVAKYVDALAGMGTAGSGAHSERETVHLPSIKRQAKRAAILMSRLAQQTSD